MKKQVKLAKFGCHSCGIFTYAPADMELGYHIIPCNCGGAWYKGAGAKIPEDVQSVYDERLVPPSEASIVRKLKNPRTWRGVKLIGRLDAWETGNVVIMDVGYVPVNNRLKGGLWNNLVYELADVYHAGEFDYPAPTGDVPPWRIKGVTVKASSGDGMYPVYAVFDHDGTVKRLVLELDIVNMPLRDRGPSKHRVMHGHPSI